MISFNFYLLLIIHNSIFNGNMRESLNFQNDKQKCGFFFFVRTAIDMQEQSISMKGKHHLKRFVLHGIEIIWVVQYDFRDSAKNQQTAVIEDEDKLLTGVINSN